MGQDIRNTTRQSSPVATKKELQDYLSEIEQRVVNRSGADVTALVALNQILRMPNAAELIDGEIRDQMKDLWIKLKTSGIAVDDPPMLFGLPADFSVPEPTDDLHEADADVPTVLPPTTAPTPKKKQEKPSTPSEDLPH